MSIHPNKCTGLDAAAGALPAGDDGGGCSGGRTRRANAGSVMI